MYILKRHKMTQSSRNEQGNVLFIILIAVAIFGMLSVAVMNSRSSTGGSTTSIAREASQLQVTALLSWVDSVKSSVDYMMLNNDTIISGISFKDPRPDQNASTAHAENTDNPNSRGVMDEVFHPSGGGAVWRDFSVGESAIFSTFFNAQHAIADVGTSAADLAFFIVDFPLEQCVEVNKKAGLGHTEGSFPTDTTTVTAHYKGSFGAATIDNVEGAPYGCFLQNASPETFWFYYVIIPR